MNIVSAAAGTFFQHKGLLLLFSNFYCQLHFIDPFLQVWPKKSLPLVIFVKPSRGFFFFFFAIPFFSF